MNFKINKSPVESGKRRGKFRGFLNRVGGGLYVNSYNLSFNSLMKHQEISIEPAQSFSLFLPQIEKYEKTGFCNK